MGYSPAFSLLHREQHGWGVTAVWAIQVAPSCKERWRAHRSHTAATAHPVAGLGPWLSLSPMGMVLLQWMVAQERSW